MSNSNGRMGRTAWIGVTVFLVSACAGGAGSTAPTATSTVTVTATSSPIGTPTSTTPASTVLHLGDRRVYDWGNVTVLHVDQSIPVSDRHLPGVKTWAGILVRTCVTAEGKKGKPTTLGWNAWTASDRRDGQYESFPWTGITYPSPTYPMDRPLAVGQCVRGWIIFNKPAGVRIMTANYGPSTGDPAVWQLAK